MPDQHAHLDIDPHHAAPKIGRARRALLKRLADVVSLPSSRVNAFERSMIGDLLIEMLRDADPVDRLRVSKRIASLGDIPAPVMRLLLRDSLDIAGPLIEESPALTDADLIGCIRDASSDHRLAIARRKVVSEIVAEALVASGEPHVIDALLRNDGARLSQIALEEMVAESRENPAYIPILLRRSELRPSQAYVMFWWSGPDERQNILSRFAVSREILQEAAGDVFPMASEEKWQDPLVRKALQFIERRQRNRAAIEKSPYASLEDAVAAAQSGMTRETASEISYLAGLKPMTGAKILTDPTGEPLAIMCKATGLPKSAVRALWKGLRRPETDSAGNVTPALERTLIIYDMMAVDRAQTVLRYWNWALSSALTPALIGAIRRRDEEEVDEYSPAQRAAMLALGGDFRN
ncbi:MAG: DUF2336 domain-containing protein [Caulobacteraceae bacterium]